jgi:hypothetical protein
MSEIGSVVVVLQYGQLSIEVDIVGYVAPDTPIPVPIYLTGKVPRQTRRFVETPFVQGKPVSSAEPDKRI